MCLSNGVFPEEFFSWFDFPLRENEGDKMIVVETLLAKVWTWKHVEKELVNNAKQC
jgi:hypothetical protein